MSPQKYFIGWILVVGLYGCGGSSEPLTIAPDDSHSETLFCPGSGTATITLTWTELSAEASDVIAVSYVFECSGVGSNIIGSGHVDAGNSTGFTTGVGLSPVCSDDSDTISVSVSVSNASDETLQDVSIDVEC